MAFYLTIAAVIFFPLSWVLKKFAPKFKYGTAAAAVFSIAVAPFVWLTCFIGYMAYQDHIPQREFNSEQWINSVDARKHMKDDIAERDLVGKSRVEIRQLLGTPSWGVADTAGLWTYDMGSSSAGFGWAFHSLLVKFERDTVVTINVSEHLD